MLTQIERTTFSRRIPESSRLPELDGLRAIAILQVLIWHSCVGMIQVPTHLAGLGWGLYRLLFLTWSGVDLFFVLSGFLIGGILLDNKNSPNYFKTFYARRFCRILP